MPMGAMGTRLRRRHVACTPGLHHACSRQLPQPAPPSSMLGSGTHIPSSSGAVAQRTRSVGCCSSTRASSCARSSLCPSACSVRCGRASVSICCGRHRVAAGRGAAIGGSWRRRPARTQRALRSKAGGRPARGQRISIAPPPLGRTSMPEHCASISWLSKATSQSTHRCRMDLQYGPASRCVAGVLVTNCAGREGRGHGGATCGRNRRSRRTNERPREAPSVGGAPPLPAPPRLRPATAQRRRGVRPVPVVPPAVPAAVPLPRAHQALQFGHLADGIRQHHVALADHQHLAARGRGRGRRERGRAGERAGSTTNAPGRRGRRGRLDRQQHSWLSLCKRNNKSHQRGGDRSMQVLRKSSRGVPAAP